MTVNRRKLFGWLAAAPVAAVAAKEAFAAPAAAPINDGPPLGKLRRMAFPVAAVQSGAHTHTLCAAAMPEHAHTITNSGGYWEAEQRLQIWDGVNWVDLNSPQGVAAHNAALAKWRQ